MTYYEKEWALLCEIFDSAYEDWDIPFYILDTSFSMLQDEYKKHPDVPPSILLMDALNKAKRYEELAKTELSANIFEWSADMIEQTLCVYLQDILFVPEDEYTDYAAKTVAVPRYFSNDEYEKLKEITK